MKMERFADAETGTGSTPGREAVRDRSTLFALLTALTMTNWAADTKAIYGTSHERRQFVKRLLRARAHTLPFFLQIGVMLRRGPDSGCG
jgi:hypothetical protein